MLRVFVSFQGMAGTVSSPVCGLSGLMGAVGITLSGGLVATAAIAEND
jgi:hypothetical protein